MLRAVAESGRTASAEYLPSASERLLGKKKVLRKRFWGVFIIAVHRAFVLNLGARHRGVVELSEEGVIRDM